MKRRIRNLTYIFTVLTCFLFFMIVAKAGTYESASFGDGSYMYGSIVTTDSYRISGTTSISNSSGTATVKLKAIPYAGSSYAVTRTETDSDSVSTSISSAYALKEYYGTHTAKNIHNITRTVGTSYVKS